MDCPYGLYSISETGLIAADKWTWNEIPEKWRLASLYTARPGQFVLHCGGGKNRDKQYADWERLGVIESVDEAQNFQLYKVLQKIPSNLP
jgi:hypothetical protein